LREEVEKREIGDREWEKREISEK